MSERSRSLALALARRLVITCQRLVTAETLLGLVWQPGCLQADPLNVVARSHLPVLWSRLEDYDPALLGGLFEYRAHAALLAHARIS